MHWQAVDWRSKVSRLGEVFRVVSLFVTRVESFCCPSSGVSPYLVSLPSDAVSFLVFFALFFFLLVTRWFIFLSFFFFFGGAGVSSLLFFFDFSYRSLRWFPTRYFLSLRFVFGSLLSSFDFAHLSHTPSYLRSVSLRSFLFVEETGRERSHEEFLFLVSFFAFLFFVSFGFICNVSR